jgi:nucleotide-binding universal stress UspA family protein
MDAQKKNVILVPVDFSPVSENALEHAIQIAKTFDNEIALLHIVEENFFGIGRDGIKEKMMEDALQMKLDTYVADGKEHGVLIHKHLREGKIYKTIVDMAVELGCDSIIMGTNGASGIQKIAGSNASRVISHSTVPVVVVKHKRIGQGYKNIVLPIDLTLESKQKVSWAIHLGKKFGSVIHIISEKENDEFLANRIHANLAQVESMLDKNGVKYESHILDSTANFAKRTLQYAEDTNADLIMIMTQQEKGFSEYIIGSYAQQIVNNAGNVPVMCVNPRETGFTSEVGY